MPRAHASPVCRVAAQVLTVTGITACLVLACRLGTAGPLSAQVAAGPDALYRAGYEAYSRGDLAAAHARFARLVQLAPQVAVGHAAYGEVLLAEGKPDAARDQLELAHKLDPKTAATSVALAEAWRALGDPARAEAAFDEARAAGASLSPQEARDEAELLDASGRAERAEEVLRAALESRRATAQPMAPTDSALLEDALGSLLAKRSSLEEAASHFTAALTAESQFAPAHEHLGC